VMTATLPSSFFDMTFSRFRVMLTYEKE
jgi:hypothetical protein